MKKIIPAFILSLIVGACTIEEDHFNNSDDEYIIIKIEEVDSIEEYVWDEEIQRYRSIFIPAN